VQVTPIGFMAKISLTNQEFVLKTSPTKSNKLPTDSGAAPLFQKMIVQDL
jgi:hypothetical protein